MITLFSNLSTLDFVPSEQTDIWSEMKNRTVDKILNHDSLSMFGFFKD